MSTCRRLRRRTAHTLIELVTAMVASTILLGGLAGVMFIGREIAYTPSAAAERTSAASILAQLAEELRYATLILEQTPRALEFVIPDRDADGAAERIRYAWSGTAGDPLQKRINGAAPVDLAASVEHFQLDYLPESEIFPLETTTESAEEVIDLYAASGDFERIEIGNGSGERWAAQLIAPASLASGAPPGARSWNATRVSFVADPESSADETLRVELRSSTSSGPSSQALAWVDIDEEDLNDNTVDTFDLTARELSLHTRHALVWANYGGGEAARLYHNDANQSTSTVFESSDAGASWNLTNNKQIYFALHGTFNTPGPVYNVTRARLAHMRLTLQTAAASHARVESSIALANRPDLSTSHGYWRLDFDADPTAIDANADDTPDWTMAGGNTFATSSLEEGIWRVDGTLESRPLHDFDIPTILEARCRAGAVVRIHADCETDAHAPLELRIESHGSSAQRLTLQNGTTAGRPNILYQVTGLAGDLTKDESFIRVRLLIVPAHDLVNLEVNDHDMGTFTYTTTPSATTERFLSLSGNNAEFDYVELRFSDTTTAALAAN